MIPRPFPFHTNLTFSPAGGASTLGQVYVRPYNVIYEDGVSEASRKSSTVSGLFYEEVSFTSNHVFSRTLRNRADVVSLEK